ncbi:hypothetical protein BU16DRAFT_610365 [Lophium mytilinum]|uniref:Uncharacterized protein n=1 Tax=Lophium mytilinum TaxID=390894 RepID=A0A6A6QTE0_9PEZI|nr:hypothetical protein BU16DRAFT_610365 [Lophium mytilinum]
MGSLTSTQITTIMASDVQAAYDSVSAVMAAGSNPPTLPSLPVEILDIIYDHHQDMVEKDLQGSWYTNEQKRWLSLNKYTLRLACKELNSKSRLHFARHYFRSWSINVDSEEEIQDLEVISNYPDFAATLQGLTINVCYFDRALIDGWGPTPLILADPVSIAARQREYNFFEQLENRTRISQIVSRLSSLKNVTLAHNDINRYGSYMRLRVLWEEERWLKQNSHIFRVTESFLAPMFMTDTTSLNLEAWMSWRGVLGLDIKFFKMVNGRFKVFSELRSLAITLVNFDAGCTLIGSIAGFVECLNSAPMLSSLHLRSNLEYNSRLLVKSMGKNLILKRLDNVRLDNFRLEPEDVLALVRNHRTCLTTLHFKHTTSMVDGSWKGFLENLRSDPAGLRAFGFEEAYDDCKIVSFSVPSGWRPFSATIEEGEDMKERLSQMISWLGVQDKDDPRMPGACLDGLVGLDFPGYWELV